MLHEHADQFKRSFDFAERRVRLVDDDKSADSDDVIAASKRGRDGVESFHCIAPVRRTKSDHVDQMSARKRIAAR